MIKNIDMRTLGFFNKFSETSFFIYVNEEDILLHEVIENNILYLGKNAIPNKAGWSYLNEKCKFNYGRFIANEDDHNDDHDPDLPPSRHPALAGPARHHRPRRRGPSHAGR